jgi:glycosyltransferase involved in cell wall biosynthesis
MKNHGQLIEAFAKLYEQTGRPDIHLVIVGEGPLRPSLETLARSRGVLERIVFFGFSDAPQKICPSFDVFCFPSTSGESLGIALIEAMSCGCPAIAAATGGVPEILNDERFGWLIPSGDESALLTAMRLALELDKESLQRLGSHAREHIVKKFNGAARWSELAQFIEQDSK